MKIIVCVKEVIDTTLRLGYGQASEALLQKGLSYRLNPLDAQALAEALQLKARDPGIEIILLSSGTERVESYLRDGLAMGADKAVRILPPDEASFGEQDLTPYQNAQILSGAISLLGADLILVGARSLDNSSGLVGTLLAARLGLPCICEAVNFQLENQKQAITAIRNLRRGIQEKVFSTLPAVLAIAGGQAKLPYASLEKVLESQEASIKCLSLSDIGISYTGLKSDPAPVTGLSFPRPRPKAAPLDSSLPAFYRILALLEGGITRRRGEILKGNTDELVDQLFELLLKEEVIRTGK